MTYVARKLGLAFLVALAVSLMSFLLLRASGDIAIALAGEGARSEDIEEMRRVYGLDQPITMQYFNWLFGMLRGDFGRSFYYRSGVIELIASKMPVTALLAVLSLAFAIALSLPLGVLAAVYRNSWVDRLCSAVAVIGQALPNFFFALVLIIVFGVMLRWAPVSGSGSLMHYLLPTIALGYYVTPPFMRLVRAGMVEVLGSDYVRTARAKGLSSASIIFKHALRNALVPVVALAAVQLGLLLAGSVVIETIFALDGLGYLAYQSIIQKDVPVTQAVVTLLSFVYIGLTLAADLLNAWIDPRLRTE